MSSDAGKKYDVGVLGWWYGKNYGSILTYFGLNRAIEKLGYNVLMVHEALGYNGHRVLWPEDILSVQFAKRQGYSYTEQLHHTQLARLNDDVGTFVVGSDQLWNPLIGRVNDDLFLDFVSADNRRVAYATSFGNRGTAKFTPEFIKKQSENLQRFNAISVREGYAVPVAKDVFGVEAIRVADPVFLLGTESYEALAAQATAKVSGDYLAVFFLDPTPEKKSVAIAIAEKLGLKKIVVIPNPDRGRKLAVEMFNDPQFEILAEDSPENFLHVYSQSKYVVTDSFHGTAFSIIFQKPFSSIYNTHRGADRFKNLLSTLGLGETRRVFETDTVEKIQENANISLQLDYTKCNKLIDAERKSSLRWLKSAISPEVGTSGALGLLDTVKEKYLAIVPTKSTSADAAADTVTQPSFRSNNSAWQITLNKDATALTVAPGAAVRGNFAWCELPFALQKNSAYRLTINWKIRTTGRAVNLHIRNEDTGKFSVIGSVPVNKSSNTPHADSVDFIAGDDGFSQFMIGAVHFTGEKAGAEVSSLSVEQITRDAVKTDKKNVSYADKAMEVALKDHERYVRATGQSMAANNVAAARVRVMFHAHAIEKGLSRSDFRPGFGKIAVPNLAKEMNNWVAAGRDVTDAFFEIGASVMNLYFDRHKKIKTDVSEFRSLFSAPVLALIEKTDQSHGGVVAAQSLRELQIQSAKDRNFLDVVYGRRSVREFTPVPVADEDIQRAVQIAMQAPSVCNRQAARVHQFADPKQIQAALDLQGGFSGYKVPPRLLLVTSDLTAFLFAPERHQPFVDGGLFMMALLLGFEQLGLGTCSLNTAMNADRENAIRKLLNIPETEVFIAFIAVGHYDPEILIPRSKRIPAQHVLVKH